jgi:hypothetical protein
MESLMSRCDNVMMSQHRMGELEDTPSNNHTHPRV